MDKLRSLEIFIATCDQGSFAGAARACNTDPSTVSKAIARLEAQLKLTLFQRSTRQLRITDAGTRYLHTVRHLFKELTLCEEELKCENNEPSGVLRISSAVCYGHLYIRPLLKTFCQQYPNIQIDFEVNDLHVDIIDNNIDLAIRTGFVKDSRLVARRLSPMDFLTCASPQYLKKHGTPRVAEEFKEHAWIGFKFKESQMLQPILLPDAYGLYQPVELRRSHVTDDGEAMANMCADGMGVAQLPHFLVKQLLASNELVSLFPAYRLPQPETGVFAIYPKRDYLPAKVRVFIDFLTNALEANGEDAYSTWATSWQPIFTFDGQD